MLMELSFVLAGIIIVLTGVSAWLWHRLRSLTAAHPVPDAQPHSDDSFISALRMAIDALPDAMYLADTNNRLLIANQQYAQQLGFQNIDDLLGKTMRDVFPPEQAEAYLAEDQMVMKTGQPFRLEIPHEAADGSHEWFHILKVPIRQHDKIIGVMGMIRNITEVRTSQESLYARIAQFRLLSHIDADINSTLDMRYVANSALDILLRFSQAEAGFIAIVTDNSEELRVVATLGAYPNLQVNSLVKAHEGVLGRVLRTQKPELISDVASDPDYTPMLRDTRAMIVMPMLSQDHLVGAIKLETSRPHRFNDDVYQFAQLVAARIALAVENANLYTLVQHKLGEMEKLYHETQALFQEKSRLEQLKTDMIRIASHDLKNPLSVIQGYIMIMRMEEAKLHEEVRGFLGEMERSAARMSKILQDILSLEKIDQRARGEFRVLNLESIVNNLYAEFLPQAQLRNQTLELQRKTPASYTIEGDEAQLYEALANLVSNAIKYTPEGGQVTLSLDRSDQHVVFKVRDTGYGIPDDMQKRLFEPFYRAKTDETIDIEGTGLGLHLVKNIVERHTGVLIFESTYGKGSLFGFSLPAKS
jgi:PAS domain S-box-containing protein